MLNPDSTSKIVHHKKYRIDLFEEVKIHTKDFFSWHEENYITFMHEERISTSPALLNFIERNYGTFLELEAGMIYYLSSKSFWEFLIYKSNPEGEMSVMNVISPQGTFENLHEASKETKYRKPIVMLFTGNIVTDVSRSPDEGARVSFEFLIEDKLVFVPAIGLFRAIYSFYELCINFITLGEYNSKTEDFWPDYNKYGLKFVK